MEIFKSYAYFIDDIRRQKGFTVRKLCEDIVNERTYRRYLSGELQLSQNKIIMFCEKLGVGLNDFYQSFAEKDRYEFGTLYELYLLLYNQDFLNFEKRFYNYNSEYFTNNMNKRFYEFLNIKYLYDTNKITMYFAFDKFGEIIDFPNNISNRIFDFSDILVLVSLSTIERKISTTKYDATKLLKRVLLKQEIRYLSTNGKSILPSIYASLSMSYGNMGDLDSCEELANEGIEQSKTLSSNVALTDLYFSRSLARFHKGKKEDAYIDATRCLSNTIAINDKGSYKHYYEVFFKFFGIDPESLFKIVFDQNRV